MEKGDNNGIMITGTGMAINPLTSTSCDKIQVVIQTQQKILIPFGSQSLRLRMPMKCGIRSLILSFLTLLSHGEAFLNETSLIPTKILYRHPCNEKPSVVADFGLRLQEGIQDLKLEQQLAPAREAVTRTLTVGSTNFLKAVEGVRERWTQRTAATAEDGKSSRASTPPVEVTKLDVEDAPRTARPADYNPKFANLRPFSLTRNNSLSFASPTSPNPPASASAAMASPAQQLSAWSAGLGSFFSAKASRFSMMRTPTASTASSGDDSPPATSSDSRMRQPIQEEYGEVEGSPLFNGMSPGVSPTESDAGVPNISSVLKSSRLVPGGSTAAAK